jgi:hypothetical protein
VPQAVDDEAGGADDVDPLIEGGLAGQPAERKQGVGEQDQQGANPAGDLDRDLGPAQAASFLRT